MAMAGILVHDEKDRYGHMDEADIRVRGGSLLLRGEALGVCAIFRKLAIHASTAPMISRNRVPGRSWRSALKVRNGMIVMMVKGDIFVRRGFGSRIRMRLRHQRAA
jgi:hypothetical protein